MMRRASVDGSRRVGLAVVPVVSTRYYYPSFALSGEGKRGRGRRTLPYSPYPPPPLLSLSNIPKY